MGAETITIILGIAVPIVLSAVGGAFSAQVNVFNIGLEGMMLAGAFFGFWASDATGNVLVGFLIGCAAGIVAALVLAVIIVGLGADEIVAGIAYNLAMLAITATLLRSWFDSSGSALSRTAGTLGRPFAGLGTVPLVGPALARLDVLMLAMLVIVVLAELLTARTTTGLRMRALGSSAAAVRSAGLDATRYKYLAFVLGGALCGVAGAYLPLASLSIYTNNMTNGIGFIALAAVIMSRGRPLFAGAAALLFAAASAGAIELQTSGLPTEVVLAAPYLAAIAAVTWRTARSRQPAGTTARTS